MMRSEQRENSSAQQTEAELFCGLKCRLKVEKMMEESGIETTPPSSPTSAPSVAAAVTTDLSLTGSRSVSIGSVSSAVPPVHPLPVLPSPAFSSPLTSAPSMPSHFLPPSTLGTPFTSSPAFSAPSPSGAPLTSSVRAPLQPSASGMSAPPVGPPKTSFSMSAGYDITRGHAGRTPQTPLMPTFSSPTVTPGQIPLIFTANFLFSKGKRKITFLLLQEYHNIFLFIFHFILLNS
ncbi:hypothetical protein LDENG_00279100 [Lucifuga dentata]|nr:hypothetical protein LDENG_00279100 [Lucifuga dentata]